MTPEEVTVKIDELQKKLNQVTQEIAKQNPVVQNLLGQLQAYNEMLAEKENPDPKTKVKE